jgi:hypothetical protein
MEILVVLAAVAYFGLCSAVGAAAESKNRSAGLWFLFALIYSPIIAILFVIAFAPVNRDAALSAGSK